MTTKTVAIYGAPTLKRFSEGILAKGFRRIGWDVILPLPHERHACDAALFQIHGSEAAHEADIKIMRNIASGVSVVPSAVLVHRPDEVQDRHPDLRSMTGALGSNFGLSQLGNYHINDPFFNLIPRRKVIPHCFFDLAPVFQDSPIVVGSHTTWGDGMRSVAHALYLIGELFELNREMNIPIVGYVGGKPGIQIDSNRLKSIVNGLSFKVPIQLLDAHLWNIDIAVGQFPTEHVILYDTKDVMPITFGVTFNTQMYHYGDRIRTGESSGSAHALLSIPAVLLMNGAETLENLKAIKVPFGSVTDHLTINFKSGARRIFEAIRSGEHKDMLRHNYEQSQKFNCEYAANQYVEFFKELGLKD